MALRKYEHREIDADHGYEVWYVAADYSKKVDKDKPDYIKWLAQGNIPRTVRYVRPPDIDISILRAQAIRLSEARRTEKLSAGFEFNGKTYDTSPSSRELLSYVVQIAEMKPSSYTRDIVLKNGENVILNKTEILTLYPAMLMYGETIYDEWLREYRLIMSANKENLKSYLSGGQL